MDDQNRSNDSPFFQDGDPPGNRCPACGERFPADVDVCPRDGTPLIAEDTAPLSEAPPQPPRGAPRSATLVVDPATGDSGAAPTAPGPPEPDPGTLADPPGEPDPGTLTEPPGEADPGGVADGAREPKRMPDSLVGTLLRNKWKVLERVGSGSFGTVYKVQDVKGGWIDALKILSVDRLVGMDAEHARKRFLREAQLVKRLGKDSPHIVGLSTYEEDLEAGLIYFLMDFVEGESLAEILRVQGPFTPERAIHLALQVCDALIVAHEGAEPVVHRDLKLENIMLTRGRGGEEIAKVLDFGIAKIAEREQDSRLTEAGTSLGTPGFAAPEQLRAGAVDGRTDLFAFGVILYMVLTGMDPWLGEPAGESSGKIYELMVASERGEVRPIQGTGVDVPPALAGVVLKLLKRDPNERFSSARELKNALEALEAGLSTRRTATGVGQGRRRAAIGVSTPVLAAGVVGILALLVLILARPWGRTLDLPALLEQVADGGVTRVRLSGQGIRGNLRTLGFIPSPFTVPLSENEMAAAVPELRNVGAEVDVAWQLRRLRDRAVEAQARMLYFGHDGDDVRGYAERMLALDPDSPEARSLLRKVAERMAWDADAAFRAGSAGVARNLLRECREVIPDYPRCEAVAAGGT